VPRAGERVSGGRAFPARRVGCYGSRPMHRDPTHPSLLRAAPPVAEPSTLEPPQTTVAVALGVYVALLVTVFAVSATRRALGQPALPSDTASDLATGAEVLAFCACVLAWVPWQLRAARNAQRLRREPLRHSPAFGVVAYFIPGLNLVVPFRAVREIWAASHRSLDAATPGLVTAWWTTWVLAPLLLVLLKTTSVVPAGGSTLGLYVSATAAAGLGLAVVLRINRAQAEAR
jgi:cytochrome bd-type quinol oxidase subunit 2